MPFVFLFIKIWYRFEHTDGKIEECLVKDKVVARSLS
jgi:hypothetical protein